MRILLILAAALLASLAASYGLRYGLMEEQRWVGLCSDDARLLACEVRHGLGLLIHYGVLPWTALGLALLANVMRGGAGAVLATLAASLAIASLVLYSAGLGAFGCVLAALRLARLLPQRARG